jgi:hypothetical protein
MKNFEDLLKEVKFEEILLAGMAGICFLTAIADFVGILHSVEFLSERIPGMILLFLSAMAIYMIGEKRGKLNDIEMLTKSKANDILKELSGNYASIFNLIKGEDNIRIFENPETMYGYLIERYQNVKTRIDMTHFGDKAYRVSQDEKLKSTANSKFYNLLNQIIIEGEIKVNRVVLVRSDDSLSWINEMMSEFADKPYFYLGCYANKAQYIHLISLMILDDEEVLITYGEKMLEDHRRTLSIKSPLAVKFFQEYFNCLLRDSIVVKSETVHDEMFTELSKKFTQ